MNNEDPNGKREAPPRPTRSLTPADQETLLEHESVSLSPERISDGASATTFILHKILEQDQKSHDYRHWGINE
jgi:hypothetical protein